MFDKEFYPTPRNVIERMGIDCEGKTCLEPSAGKGDIVDYLKELGAKDVEAMEKNDDLRKIVGSKCRIIGSDFFQMTADQISHIQLIVMNPPFSAADKHILHAWKIAPEGCEIIALCNWQTVENRNYIRREELGHLINDYGNKENLGDCFTNADRKTDAEVGLIHLFKPGISSGFDFDSFYFTDEAEQSSQSGLMKYSEIRAIVNSYVAAVKCFDRFRDVADEMNQYTRITDFGHGFTFQVGCRDEGVVSKTDFAKAMQKHCWNHVFKQLNVQRFVTKGVMKDINAFVENQQAVPFTMRNIYRMIEIIIGTRGQIMNRAIVEAIDNFTKHTHENRYGLEGWKTNAGHLLNKKFITGWISEPSFSGGLRIRDYQGNFEKIIDLTKAICYLTGKDFDEITHVGESSFNEEDAARVKEHRSKEIKAYHSLPYPMPKSYNIFHSNTWYSWGFFEFKVFKKGTGHFKFKDEKVWELLNRKYAEIKGQVLPEKL